MTRIAQFARAILGDEQTAARRPRTTERRDYLDDLGSSYRARAATASSFGVTSSSSLRHSAVFACRALISGTVADFPLHVYRPGPDGRLVRQPSPPLIVAPSPTGLRPKGWRYAIVDAWLSAGYAAGLVTTAGFTGWPDKIELLETGRATWTKRNGVVEWRIDGVVEPLWEAGGRLWISPSRYQIAGLPVGLSVLDAARYTIELGVHAQTFGSDWFRGGAHPSGVVGVGVDELDDDQARAIKERFVESVAGRQPVVLANSATYSPIQIQPEESQFLESLQANVADIARFYSVPPESIGGTAGNSLTYQNGEALARRLHLQATGPWLGWLEDELTRLLPGDLEVRGNPGALLRMDTKTRYEAHEIGIRAGFLTIDEARDLEDWAPLPDTAGSMAPEALAAALQKIYLAVGTVITADEARSILNRSGAGLPVPGPELGGK